MFDISKVEFLREDWRKRVSQVLSSHEAIESEIFDDLTAFIDNVAKAMETANPAWVEPNIEEWVKNTSLFRSRDSIGTIMVLGKIQDASIQFFLETLPPEQFPNVAKLVLSVFAHGMNYAAKREVEEKTNQLEHELRKARASLSRVEKSKSDFISIAAHELKTPLTLIEGYTSMLHEARLTDENQRLQSGLCIKGINAGTRRLRDIVDDMIDISIIDNNLLTLNYQPIWINQICAAIYREYKDTIRQRQQTFLIKEFQGGNEVIYADGERIYQAIKNLVSNAIKFTPDEGTIVLDGRLLQGFIEVTVKDTGIGIDQENHQRIFEKFGNLGNPSLHSSGKTKFKGGGPGLGLPITKGIIEAHGGAIWVESECQDEVRCPGSVFHLLIPFRKFPPDKTPDSHQQEM